MAWEITKLVGGRSKKGEGKWCGRAFSLSNAYTHIKMSLCGTIPYTVTMCRKKYSLLLFLLSKTDCYQKEHTKGSRNNHEYLHRNITKYLSIDLILITF